MSLPRLRAPAEHGAILAHPPLAEVGDRIERNRSALAQTQVVVASLPLPELRRRAIAEAVAAASAYLRSASEPLPESVAGVSDPGHKVSLLLAGHQPELFHPGVWLKNFALNSLARRHGAQPLNLIVDNDTVKSTAIRLPVLGAPDDPRAVHLSTVAFDHFAGEIVYEERAVHDEAQFAAFARRVAELTANWGYEPILPEFWQDVLRQRERTPLIGERFASARRLQERRWGCHNLEVPLSHLCRTEAFAHFVSDLLHRLPDFHTAYNDIVHDYRRRHGIRSRNHPVPDLARDGDWLEAPLWVWRTGAVQRGRLFVRANAGGWQLRAGDDPWPDVPRVRTSDHWRRLEGDGYKVRPRALTTTLFARLLLADLFVHGIGGGKYDELTDTLLARHYGIEPPAFLVLTGTLHLPLPAFPTKADDLRAKQRLVRDLYWNPQRHLPAVAAARPEVEAILRGRAAWQVEQWAEPLQRWERYERFRAASQRLRPWVADEIAAAQEDVERARAEVAANAVLRRRDYSFSLFPAAELQSLLSRRGW